jgi:hypothetical protein
MWSISKEIDEIIYTLYGINKDEKEDLRKLYQCDSVSEYFDRLEKYVGVEDTDDN